MARLVPRPPLVLSLALLAALALPAALHGQNPDYVLRVTDAAGAQGEIVDVSVLLDNTGDPITSLSLSVCHDPADLLVVGALPGAAVVQSNPEFLAVTLFADGWSIALVMSFSPPFNAIAPGINLEMAIASYEILPPGPGSTILEICSADIGTTGGPVVPVTQSGVITIVTPGTPLFRRGDINGDGDVTIADAIFIIYMIFIWPPFTPDCFDAADVNDDGTTNIADPIGLLVYLFLSGNIPPPGPIDCGPDPTPDVLPACDYDPGLCP
ncbi:MAG: dockerin type I domain-containing protein [Planctomycetota bacterium]